MMHEVPRQAGWGAPWPRDPPRSRLPWRRPCSGRPWRRGPGGPSGSPLGAVLEHGQDLAGLVEVARVDQVERFRDAGVLDRPVAQQDVVLLGVVRRQELPRPVRRLPGLGLGQDDMACSEARPRAENVDEVGDRLVALHHAAEDRRALGVLHLDHLGRALLGGIHEQRPPGEPLDVDPAHFHPRLALDVDLRPEAALRACPRAARGLHDGPHGPLHLDDPVPVWLLGWLHEADPLGDAVGCRPVVCDAGRHLYGGAGW
mmetsp:Transcript_54687/g.153883  ORF Transcript_54687/g.153883 Transcript_54687/m.153883 type:complete len:258 (+) Transcript_54687:165-938(+)